MLHFFAALSWPQITGLLVAAGLFVYGWLKRKVIAAVWNAVTAASTRRFWSWVHQQVSTHAPPTTQTAAPDPKHRTYKGTFELYQAHLHGQRFFTIVQDDGTSVTVPVMQTPLLQTLRRGDVVEIDTVADVSFGREAVQRVRKINRGAQ